eukprot:1998338-Rhodomonas_salina.1
MPYGPPTPCPLCPMRILADTEVCSATPTRLRRHVRYLPTRLLCYARYLPTRLLCCARYALCSVHSVLCASLLILRSAALCPTRLLRHVRYLPTRLLWGAMGLISRQLCA